MDLLEITPPVGPVGGSIRLDGGKHSFAHSLACAALADEGTILDVPNHLDSKALRAGLKLIFNEVEYDPLLRILSFGAPRNEPLVVIPRELAATSRSLFCLYPALLARAREVQVAAPPSGCAIGSRPSTWYIDTLSAFGVVASETGGVLRLSWADRRPADVLFDYPTMTGTVVAIAAAAAVIGRSTISNRSVEPSCDDELNCLSQMGAVVEHAPGRVVIDSPGQFPSVRWTVSHDRIHAVTYLTAGLVAGGQVTVVGSGPMRIPRFVEFLMAVGCHVREEGDRLTARLPPAGALQPTRLAVGSEPCFSSDWAPMAALLLSLRAAGPSEIVDDVFPERFQFVDSLTTHGLAPVELDKIVTASGRRAVRARIYGRADTVLRSGCYYTVPDIRGSAAIALAALAADGPTCVVDDYHIRRGYTDFAGDLGRLGVPAVRSER